MSPESLPPPENYPSAYEAGADSELPDLFKDFKVIGPPGSLVSVIVGPQRPQKISWCDPGFEARLADRQKHGGHMAAEFGGMIAGESALDAIDRGKAVQEHYNQMGQAAGDLLEKTRRKLYASMTCPNGVTSKYKARRFLEEAAGAGVWPYDQTLDTDDSTDLAGKAQTAVQLMTHEELETFLRFHAGAEAARLKKFDEVIANLKEDFLLAVENAINESRLPASIKPDKVRRKIDKLKFVGLDPLFASGIGYYNFEDHAVLMLTASVEEDIIDQIVLDAEDGESLTIPQVFAHETLHALGGKTVVKHEGDSNVPVFVVRTGLSYIRMIRGNGQEQQDEYSRRFVWLEEAANELAYDRVVSSGSKNRRSERKLLELLRTKGNQCIPEDLLLEAKFEDFEPDAHSSERILAWKRLRKAINHAYDNKFLIELDDIIRMWDDAQEGSGIKWANDFLERLEPGRYGESGNTIQEEKRRLANLAGLRCTAGWQDIIASLTTIERY